MNARYETIVRRGKVIRTSSVFGTIEIAFTPKKDAACMRFPEQKSFKGPAPTKRGGLQKQLNMSCVWDWQRRAGNGDYGAVILSPRAGPDSSGRFITAPPLWILGYTWAARISQSSTKRFSRWRV